MSVILRFSDFRKINFLIMHVCLLRLILQYEMLFYMSKFKFKMTFVFHLVFMKENEDNSDTLS